MRKVVTIVALCGATGGLFLSPANAATTDGGPTNGGPRRAGAPAHRGGVVRRRGSGDGPRAGGQGPPWALPAGEHAQDAHRDHVDPAARPAQEDQALAQRGQRLGFGGRPALLVV